MENCFCHFNGYEVKDAKSRKSIEDLNAHYKANEDEINALRERMNSFTSLPEGSTAGDAELIDMHIGYDGEVYTNAGSALRSQVKDIHDFNQAEKENQRIKALTRGHLERIIPAQNRKMFRYKETSGVIGEDGTVPGSGYIKCPEYLALYFPDSNARAYVYFFDFVGGEYVPRWDIISVSSSTGLKNYLSKANSEPFMFKIPAGVYMRIGISAGNVEVFGWDGSAFGMPLSGDCNYPKATGSADALSPAGSYGVTVPGSAEYLLSGDSCDIYTVAGYNGITATIVYSSKARRFIKLPSGYDFFKVRLVDTDVNEGKIKITTGDMAHKVAAVVADNYTVKPSAKALKIIENCKKICSIKWTPKANVPVKTELATGEAKRYFQKGVEYMGIPYASDWKKAHYIGWHVSPHTFVNAVNDENSIFYNEAVSDGEVSAPYYSLVCGAFATLAAGWPYPAINRGCLYDPNVEIHHTPIAPIGSLYSSMSHVVIPERIDYLDDGVAISAYECTSPCSQRTTRYEKVPSSSRVDVYHLATGQVFFDSYRYEYDNYLAHPDMSRNIPYINTDDVVIVGGSARPYKGDKSVYTSEDNAVYINIKDKTASILYLTKKDGEEQSISIDNASKVDVKSYLEGDGIYFVHTDVNATQESFEYHEVDAITYSMVNGVPVLDSKDFWYVMFMMSGDRRAKGNKSAMSQLPEDDYSYLIKNGAVCEYVYAIFRKGEYGAYSVPVALKE